MKDAKKYNQNEMHVNYLNFFRTLNGRNQKSFIMKVFKRSQGFHVYATNSWMV